MNLTRLKQRAYIKIAVLRGRNARDSSVRKVIVRTASKSSQCHSLAFLPPSTAILCTHAVLIESHQFCMTLDLQLRSYRPLCYNIRVHWPLLHCLCATSVILAGTYSYFVVSSF